MHYTEATWPGSVFPGDTVTDDYGVTSINTYLAKAGRMCKKCRALRMRKYKAQKKGRL